MRYVARVTVLFALACALLGVMASSALSYTPVPIHPDGFTPPPIKVAIVYSQTTLDWANKRGTPSRYPHAGKEGALRYYLESRGYDVTEIVGDRDLTDAKLANYDVVVLNSAYGMGWGASEALARFVARGGGLVSTIGSPRVNPAYAPPKGVHDELNEWWWRIFKESGGNHNWEWGPLSSLYQETFVNDGAYTPEYTLKPNPNSPIIKQTQTILSARGYNSDLSGLTLHHPGANLEMSLRLPGCTDCTSAADFNILTKSVKKLYPKNYTAIQGSLYGAGRAVKFDYGATDYLQDYSSKFYLPSTKTVAHQGEIAGALIEAAIIWAGSPDGTVAHSIEGTTYADVSAKGGQVTVKQTVKNIGNTLTRTTVKFTIYGPGGGTVKSWVTKNLTMFPHQTQTLSYVFGHALPSGTCRVKAEYAYGYPAGSVTASSSASIARGQSLRTR